MPGPISGLELVEAMIRYGEKAVEDFSFISGGEWFDEAPEYFLTTYIARSVGDQGNTYALLEVPVGQTRKEAGASRRGRAAEHERRNGRFDVVLLGKRESSCGSRNQIARLVCRRAENSPRYRQTEFRLAGQ